MHQQDQLDRHVPVLLRQVISCLSPGKGESYLDLTAGYGGHAQQILALTNSFANTVLVDRDEHAVEFLRQQFRHRPVQILHLDFYQASYQLLQKGETFDLILADLGVSSPHLNDPRRGFAIQQEGPLDMRMDQRQLLTAERVVNDYTEGELTEIFYRYGEEPQARRIARAIIQARPITTTTALAQVVASAVKQAKRHYRVHPATRVFQAVRIAVNDELALLEKSLPFWLDLLKPGGRIAIISFHSLEDRIVKKAFAEVGGSTYDAAFQILTPKPLTADAHEIAFNPRARSAKLRAAAKIKTKGRNG